MSVDRAEVERIAALAQLELTGDEAETLAVELTGILDHVEALSEVGPATPGGGGDDPGSGWAAGAPGEHTERRSRAPRPADDAEPDRLSRSPETFAPRWADGFFVVPAPPGVQEGTEP